MTLALDDPLWNELKGCYGDLSNLIQWLNQAYQPNGLSGELIGNIVNEVHHQGDSSSAMYAVAPHLIRLAEGVGSDFAYDLLTCAGAIYARAEVDGRGDCPDELEEEFMESAELAATAIVGFIPETDDYSTFVWGVSALAAFKGHGRFARLLSQLDFYENEFHHPVVGRIPLD